MLLEPSVTHQQLTAFLKEARKKDSACQPELASELQTLASRPPANWKILKDGSRSKVGSHALSDGKPVVLKYYYPKNFFKKLNYRINGSRCLNSWIAGLAFEHLGLPTPQPLCIQETSAMAGLLNSHSFLATRHFDGTALSSLPDERIANLVEPLRHVFEVFDHYHISHGDLKASNILVADDNRITFIDLDASQFLLDGREWEHARRKDRERFFQNWSDRPEVTALLNPCFP